MNCKECAKEITNGTPIMVGDFSFCNNLCKVLWSKKNPGAVSPVVWKHYKSSSSEGETRIAHSPTRRILWGLLWFILIYFVSMALIGGVIGAQQYRTTKYIWLLGIGTILLGPIYEELLFRAFLFKGFLRSALGPIGAVMLTGLLWALTHFQYEVGQIFGIFVFGIFLGLERLHTKSLWTSMAMHTVWNAAVFVETLYVVFWVSSPI